MADEDFGLEEMFETVLEDHSEDKEFYGMRYNVYNPEVHIDCMFEGKKSLAELQAAAEELLEVIEDFRKVGWELTVPITDSTMFTEWRGKGKPPTEYSMFGPDGYDLDGVEESEWITEMEAEEEEARHNEEEDPT